MCVHTPFFLMDHPMDSTINIITVLLKHVNVDKRQE